MIWGFFPFRLEEMTVDKAQFDTTLKDLEKDLEETCEELSKVSIECDVWRSKFLASRFVCSRLYSTCSKVLKYCILKMANFVILSHISTTILCTE